MPVYADRHACRLALVLDLDDVHPLGSEQFEELRELTGTVDARASAARDSDR